VSEKDPLQREHRRARRRQWILSFRERQRILRQWIAFDEIADWCARSVTGANVGAEEEARTLAYERLDQSARVGEFETICRGQTQSRILYLHPRMTGHGKDRRWLTREQLYHVQHIRDLAWFCWLPRELARQWLAAHGYPWPERFDPANRSPRRHQARQNLRLRTAIQNTLGKLGVPAEEVPWKQFCDAVRAECGVGEKTRGYGDRSIQRVFTAIKQK
jgi:hypothetical protein